MEEKTTRDEQITEQIYEEEGYESRKDYLENLSEDFGVDYETVSCLASLLGPEEDFDGLVTTLEDMDYFM